LTLRNAKECFQPEINSVRTHVNLSKPVPLDAHALAFGLQAFNSRGQERRRPEALAKLTLMIGVLTGAGAER
jgi:hypothetical protein